MAHTRQQSETLKRTSSESHLSTNEQDPEAIVQHVNVEVEIEDGNVADNIPPPPTTVIFQDTEAERKRDRSATRRKATDLIKDLDRFRDMQSSQRLIGDLALSIRNAKNHRDELIRV